MGVAPDSPASQGESGAVARLKLNSPNSDSKVGGVVDLCHCAIVAPIWYGAILRPYTGAMENYSNKEMCGKG